MKPQLLKVSKDLVNSFSARRDISPDINNRWHYHQEVELIYFKKGHGTQFVGDNISQFNTTDIILVGPNLPHYWLFDERYFDKKEGIEADVSVIHFNELFWGEVFLTLPENKEIHSILQQSRRGVRINGYHTEHIGQLMEEIIVAEGARKIILLIEVLLAFAKCNPQALLASIGFQHNFQQTEKEKIDAVYNHSIANFKNKITLKEIAGVANVSPNSFCKYFKSRSRKTYTQFLNEIRVGHACKLLINDKLNVKEICFESGFYNFATFHKCFKQITGKSPLNYQKSFTVSK
ncbi:AraC family transcriptional regulator [Mucilaginibacter terrae]|uniref:AraC family transcriptional regulator n=1 Tax=Mucilaginibacter terrae TaxID=1955052 RepID=UPI003637F1FA